MAGRRRWTRRTARVAVARWSVTVRDARSSARRIPRCRPAAEIDPVSGSIGSLDSRVAHRCLPLCRRAFYTCLQPHSRAHLSSGFVARSLTLWTGSPVTRSNRRRSSTWEAAIVPAHGRTHAQLCRGSAKSSRGGDRRMRFVRAHRACRRRHRVSRARPAAIPELPGFMVVILLPLARVRPGSPGRRQVKKNSDQALIGPMQSRGGAGPNDLVRLTGGRCTPGFVDEIRDDLVAELRRYSTVRQRDAAP